MNNDEILKQLQRESEEHTPDVRAEIPSEAPPLGEGGAAVAVRRTWPVVALAACGLALLLLLALLMPAFFRGTDRATLVISINPSAELTLEGGKVTRTRALNRDAAVLLVGKDFSGMTAEEACLSFAELADERKLITADGIRVRVTGKNGNAIESGVLGALAGRYATVGEMDPAFLEGLMNGYDERQMGDFESYVQGAYDGKREQLLTQAKELLQTYETDLFALSVSDMVAVSSFNKTYMLLGEDFLAEQDETDWEEERAEMAEDARKLSRLIDSDPDRAFGELFEGFMELLEEEYDREDEDDEDDGDDEDGGRGDRDDDDDDNRDDDDRDDDDDDRDDDDDDD